MTSKKEICPPGNPPGIWIPLRDVVRSLRFPTRWLIVEHIGNGEKTTDEIQKFLAKRGETVTGSSFYYHLSELKNAGIIEVSGYLDEGGGAPEKIWKLRSTEITINLLAKNAEDLIRWGGE